MSPFHTPYSLRLPVLIMALVLLCASSLHAQDALIDPATAGRVYMLAFPDTMQYDTDTSWHWTHKDTFTIVLYSGVANTVTMSGAGGWSRTVQLQAGVAESIYFTDGNDGPSRIVSNVTGEVRTGEAIRVEGTEPLVVYCGMATRFGAEAWTPLAVEHWGKIYVAAAGQPKLMFQVDRVDSGEYKFKRTTDSVAPSGVLVLASENNTRVRIEPVRDGLFDSTPLEVVLDAGETFQWQTSPQAYVFHGTNARDTFLSISRTRVVADKPVGVACYTTQATGTYRYPERINQFTLWRELIDWAYIFRYIVEDDALRSNTCGSPSIEWLTPREQWGRHFSSGWFERWCVPGTSPVASDDASIQVMVVSDPVQPPDSLTAAIRYWSRPWGADSNVTKDTLMWMMPGENLGMASRDSVVQSFKLDKPVQVLIASRIGDFGTVQGTGDSAGAQLMVSQSTALLAPREQWASVVPVVALPLPGAYNHIVMVITDSASREKIVDGNGQPFLFAEKVTAHGMAVGWRQIPAGEQLVLVGKDGAHFTGVCYGFRGGLFKRIEQFSPHPDTSTLMNIWLESPSLSYAYPLASRRINLETPVAVPFHQRKADGVILRANPVTGEVELSSPQLQSDEIRFKVYDARGQVLIDIEGHKTALNEAKGILRLDDLTNGIYFIVAEINNTSISSVRIVRIGR